MNESETATGVDKNRVGSANHLPAKPRRPARRHLVAILAGVLMMLTFGAWAIASPVGSSPDEDFHLASVWCGAGEREGLCGPGAEADSRLVPDNIEVAICYAHEPELSAACQGPDFNDGAFGLVESDRVNGDGLYPSGYYYVTSFLAGENMVLSVILMRIAHALLFTVLTVSLWLLLPSRSRVAYVGAMVVTFVPLGLFLIPSINPSGWAITSAALLLPSLFAYLTSDGRRVWVFAAYAVLAAVLGLAARGDSAAYTAVAALAALVLSFSMTRRYWLRALLPITLLLAAARAFLSANQTGSALGGGMAIEGADPVPKSALTVVNLLELLDLHLGVVGQNFDNSPYTGLGWLDTPLPAIVWVPTTFVFAGLFFAGLARFDTRKLIAFAGVGFAAVVIPMFLLVQNGVYVGYQVQPRYIMPLVVMLVFVALTPAGPRDTRGVTVSVVQAYIAAVLLAISGSVALFVHLRRYVAPGDVGLGRQEWWWNIGPEPVTVWVIGSAAFTAQMLLIAWRARVRPNAIQHQ